jgi:Plasmid pRiA4b ORF-3-like protein
MSTTSTKGTCHFCHRVLSKGTMTRHLETCAARTDIAATASQKPTKKTRMMHLLIEGRDQPQYWMHVELPAESTLQTLDDFLRKAWLECCGHLSKFEIAGISYASYPDPEFGDKSMRVRVDAILSPGMQFLHEYDYGTTTELRLKVVAEREAEAKGKPLQILARNEPPLIACEKCGKPATEVCAQCIYEGEGWLCDTCAQAHACGEEMLLPVVNSPRVGMCGYTGPAA